MQDSSKKTWQAPVLEVYGTVAEMTQQTFNKKVGPGDAIIYTNGTVSAGKPRNGQPTVTIVVSGPMPL